MRVLHVEGGHHLYGGAYQVLHLLKGLGACGIESHLACPHGCALAEAAAPFARVQGLPMHGDLDVLMALRLTRLIRRVQPDLVHLHSRIGGDVMGGIAARVSQVPVIHTRRVDNPEPRWLVAVKYRLFDRVIAISEGIAQVLTAEGLPAAKLRVVHSAVDWERYDRPCQREVITGRLGLPGDSPLIAVVAQLIQRKGHRILLGALPSVLSQHPRLRVLFFGQGPLAGPLADEISRAGLSQVVYLLGFRDDLPELLPCFDLVVHPALMEGLGVSLLQAASAGVPIVASRVGGIPEAVRDDLNGLLVPPGDASALGAAILRLLNDPALAARLGRGGRELMREAFSVGAMVEGNLAVYRELVG